MKTIYYKIHYKDTEQPDKEGFAASDLFISHFNMASCLCSEYVVGKEEFCMTDINYAYQYCDYLFDFHGTRFILKVVEK